MHARAASSHVVQAAEYKPSRPCDTMIQLFEGLLDSLHIKVHKHQAEQVMLGPQAVAPMLMPNAQHGVLSCLRPSHNPTSPVSQHTRGCSRG